MRVPIPVNAYFLWVAELYLKVDLSEEAREQMRSMLKQKETIYLRLKRARMDRSMFDVITKIGVGAFGEVSLVRKCRTASDDHQHLEQQLYAMKTLRKVCATAV